MISRQYAAVEDLFFQPDSKIVIATQMLSFENYPGAYNPSLFKVEQGYLLTFRYCPDPSHQGWLSYIGIVVLDESLRPITEPELLNTRIKNSKTPSQTEDARIFSYRGKLYLIYNDNVDEIFFGDGMRRDLFLSQLYFSEGRYRLSPPIKLFFEEKYKSVLQQKNWVPFEHQGNLYLSYSLHPHHVIQASLKNGECFSAYKTNPPIDWIYGTLRGSTPALLVDGEYLAFFHSALRMKSPASHNWKLWHYFTGAYTFSAQPPFEITQMTPQPILGENFYTPSYREKRVVFPGGIVDAGSVLYMAYGKDDCEIWIATLDKQELKKALVPLKKAP
jgi:predicted GH43/DUF377 family glycosyl hydrolase